MGRKETAPMTATGNERGELQISRMAHEPAVSEVWTETSVEPDDADYPMPTIASMPVRAEAPSNVRFRSAVHQVASASAALALAAIVAGIGSAAVDAFNALKIDTSAIAQAPLEAPNSALAAIDAPAMTPHDRLGFVRSAAFAAAIDRGQAPISIAMSAPAPAPVSISHWVEPSPAAQRSFAAPKAFEQKVVEVQTVAAASAAQAAPAAINLLNAQGTKVEPARAPNIDLIASLLDRADPVVPQPVLAQRKEMPVAVASASEPAREIAATAAPASEEAFGNASNPWEAKVVATTRGKRLQDELAAAERAQQMRRNAFALGVKPPASGADIAAPANPAPSAKPVDSTPWYLRSPSWSPFNRADAQSR